MIFFLSFSFFLLLLLVDRFFFSFSLLLLNICLHFLSNISILLGFSSQEYLWRNFILLFCHVLLYKCYRTWVDACSNLEKFFIKVVRLDLFAGFSYSFRFMVFSRVIFWSSFFCFLNLVFGMYIVWINSLLINILTLL